MRILRQTVDIWAVLLIVSTGAIQLACYLLATDSWVRTLVMLSLVPACASIVAYNHNHIHLNTFTIAPLNRLLEIVIFLQTGNSPYASTLNHVLGHHATYLRPERDTLNWRRADGAAMTRVEYGIKRALSHYPSCFQIGRETRSLFYRRFLVYLAICLAILTTLVAYKPLAALQLYIVPMALMLFVLKWGAYPHHTGLPVSGDETASRTHTGSFYNWITWNSGYHAAHHFSQALHWSRLPEYHRSQIATRVPRALQGPGWGEASTERVLATPYAEGRSLLSRLAERRTTDEPCD